MQIKTIIPISTLMWAVYYDYDDDTIIFTPIIAIALVVDDYQKIVPIPFDRKIQDEEDLAAFLEDPWHLGFTLSPDACSARKEFGYRILKIQKEEEKSYEEARRNYENQNHRHPQLPGPGAGDA